VQKAGFVFQFAVQGSGPERRAMTRPIRIRVRHTRTAGGAPLAVIDDHPGPGAELRPAEIQQLSRLLAQIAIDSQSGVQGVRYYPQD
jgi:predicted metalloprotease